MSRQLAVSPVLPVSSPVQSFVLSEWLNSLAENTRQAYLTSFKQFWEWNTCPEHYPIEESEVVEWIRFLWKEKKSSYSTIRVRISAISSLQETMGLGSVSGFGRVKTLLRTIRRQAPKKKKANALRKNDILKWSDTLKDSSPIEIRDRALVFFGFAAGGRRCSEIANVQYEDLVKTESGWKVSIRNHKTARDADDTIEVFVRGKAAKALEEWVEMSQISSGPLFRGFCSDGETIKQTPLSTKQINRIVKKTGADSSHSLRSGFMTTCVESGIRMEDAMAISGHKSVSSAVGYYRAGMAQNNPATNLL